MSFCTQPMVAAKSAVVAPTKVTRVSAFGAYSISGDMRQTRKTPAVTMVAAWISAETGVGPSIASGSQVCRPICADLPQAPRKSSTPISSIELQAEEGVAGVLRHGGEDLGEVDAVEGEEDQRHAEHEEEVADAVDDEGLDRRGVGALALVPVADQQVAREAHPFPAEEELGEVVRRHQHQHHEGEEREIGEEARRRRVVRHVADAVEVDQRRDEGDHRDHHRRRSCRSGAPRPARSRRRRSRWRSAPSPRGRPCATSAKDSTPQMAASTMQPTLDHCDAPEPIQRPKKPLMRGPEQGKEDGAYEHGGLSPSGSRCPRPRWCRVLRK